MIAIAWTLAAVLAAAAQPPSLAVNYPEENESVGPAKSVYILGNVQPPTATLKINGQAVQLAKRGGFLAYLPVQPGTFTFHCEATLSTQTARLDRGILVAQPMTPSPSNRKILEENFTLPKGDLELRPGDWVRVQLKATAGMKGKFKIKGLRGEVPLVEQSMAGLYAGAYQIQPGDRAREAKIYFTLKGKVGTIKAEAPGRLTIPRDSPRVAYAWPQKTALDAVRAGPGGGYMLFLPTGTRVLVNGKDGNEDRLWLSDSESGWVDDSRLRFLPPGTPPPQATLATIKTQASADGAVVRIGLSERVPYLIEQTGPDELRVRFYYAYGHVNFIVYDPGDKLVREIRWSQSASGVCLVSVKSKLPLWGYQAAYEPGGLKLDLRRAPAFAPAPQNPLKGRTIVLDPGHSPSDPGRVAPYGHTEREFNLRTALALKPLLEKAGATVILTRDNNDAEVSLQERVDIAVAHRADAFLSLHNNALPAAADPFESPHGYSIFYYHPLSLALGESVHAAYQREIKLADEGLHYGDLMVARMSAMPAIIVESAYFIFPEQEELLMTDAFHAKLAKALFQGLRDFFEAARSAGKTGQEPKK